jgi:two-component system sensor histidine kinase HydH
MTVNLTSPTASDLRMDDLAQMMEAYNDAMQNLRASHEALTDEVVRLQHELASTDAQLQRSKRLAALGEMAAGIAHEIRNPLAAIKLYTSILAEDIIDLEQAQIARKIAGAVGGLDAIVNDVLTFSREINPQLVETSASQLFERAAEVVDTGAAKIHRCDGDLLLHCDPSLMHLVLVNLLRNAADAIANRAGEIELSWLADPDSPDHVILAIRDNGSGIDDQAIDRIFNPFFTTRNTGTGLGLAIVHRIVDAHGGAITVRNDDGAVFEIRLPLNKTTKPSAAAGVFVNDGVPV